MASNPQQPSVAEPMTEERLRYAVDGNGSLTGPELRDGLRVVFATVDRLRAENARLVGAAAPLVAHLERITEVLHGRTPDELQVEGAHLVALRAALKGTP